MNLNCKYNIGDRVFYRKDNYSCKLVGYIQGVDYRHYPDEDIVYYYIHNETEMKECPSLCNYDKVKEDRIIDENECRHLRLYNFCGLKVDGKFDSVSLWCPYKKAQKDCENYEKN